MPRSTDRRSVLYGGFADPRRFWSQSAGLRTQPTGRPCLARPRQVRFFRLYRLYRLPMGDSTDNLSKRAIGPDGTSERERTSIACNPVSACVRVVPVHCVGSSSSRHRAAIDRRSAFVRAVRHRGMRPLPVVGALSESAALRSARDRVEVVFDHHHRNSTQTPNILRQRMEMLQVVKKK